MSFPSFSGLQRFFRDALLTLCAGSFCEAPKGPTMKWTSAISSLLNIKAFLKTEQVSQVSLNYCITSSPPTLLLPRDTGYFHRFREDAGEKRGLPSCCFLTLSLSLENVSSLGSMESSPECLVTFLKCLVLADQQFKLKWDLFTTRIN